MPKFSEINPKDFYISEKDKNKLKFKNVSLEKMIREFQEDLTDKNKNNLKFIKYVIKLIKDNNIKFPVLPEVANKIISLLNNDKADFNDYSEIIKSDPAITMKAIKLANSPAYRGLRDVSDINLAISRLGIDGIKELVLTDSINSIIFKNQSYRKQIDKIWRDSILTALLASEIAEVFKLNQSLLYTVSLVHKIGAILIFDIVEDFNKITDFDHYLEDDFALRVGKAFNKRLTVHILENWYFTKEQIVALKNYDIKPIPVSPIEHKILYYPIILLAAAFCTC